MTGLSLPERLIEARAALEALRAAGDTDQQTAAPLAEAARPRMGRPTLRTPERERVILQALSLGLTRKAAAESSGIAYNTFARWVQTFGDFREEVAKAESRAEARFSARILEAAEGGTWQAAAWWLERRRPDDYRRRDGVELTGKDGGPVQHANVLDDLQDHEKRALRIAIDRELAARAVAGGEE